MGNDRRFYEICSKLFFFLSLPCVVLMFSSAQYVIEFFRLSSPVHLQSDSYKHGNESSGSVKGVELRDLGSDQRLLRKDSSPDN